MKKLLCLVFSLMVAVMAAGCGGGDKQAAAPQAGKTLRLAAAASMEKVFTQKLIPLYQQKHPEIKIEGVYDASGKLQAENRSLRMQLQQSTVREQELRQRIHRCEEQLDAVLNDTRPYWEAMRVAPEQVQAFVLGICRRQQEEKRLNRQQRRQRAKGQDR